MGVEMAEWRYQDTILSSAALIEGRRWKVLGGGGMGENEGGRVMERWVGG